MKLLMCCQCLDVVTPVKGLDRKCLCGSVKGQMVNPQDLEYQGPGVVLELNRKQLTNAMHKLIMKGDTKKGIGRQISAVLLDRKNKTIVKRF